jgi:hypothetical protein
MDFTTAEQVEGGKLLLTFNGSIDEDAKFPSVDGDRFTTIEIDLQGVKAINSVGIREWLNWIRPLADKAEITLTRCPKALVFQFNMVDGFLPARTKVESFYVPFFCEKCDKEDNVLLHVGKEVAISPDTGKVDFRFKSEETVQCAEGTPASCEMEMDVTESKYFQFLKRA